jgi:hypothetical protein
MVADIQFRQLQLVRLLQPLQHNFSLDIILKIMLCKYLQKWVKNC